MDDPIYAQDVNFDTHLENHSKSHEDLWSSRDIVEAWSQKRFLRGVMTKILSTCQKVSENKACVCDLRVAISSVEL